MSDEFLRDTEEYRDAHGRSEPAEQLARIRKSDRRGTYAIEAKINVLRRTPLALLLGRLVKRPTATIYVLRVQSGPVSYRLPFFEPECKDRRLIVFTHCVKRAHLAGASYHALIEEAESRRQDWIARNCD